MHQVVFCHKGALMKNPKEATSEILKELPDDATFEDIMYRIYVLTKIEKGLAEADQGLLIDQDEAEKAMEKWLVE